MKEFSYYWKGRRQTRTDNAFLQQLTAGAENQADIIEGIKNSEQLYNSKFKPESETAV